MPIRGGLSICCASAASSAMRIVSVTVAGVRLSASTQVLIKLGYLLDEARNQTPRRSPPSIPASDLSNAPLSGRGERRRASGPLQRVVGQPDALFNDLARLQQQRRRDADAERLGGVAVDDELELRGPLDRQLGSVGPAEEPVHVTSELANGIGPVHRIVHEAAGLRVAG